MSSKNVLRSLVTCPHGKIHAMDINVYQDIKKKTLYITREVSRVNL